MTLSRVPRELAERLITRRNVRYTPHHVHHAEYFVYACGYLLWQCNDESTADKIHDEALAKFEAMIREAMQKAFEEAVKAVGRVIADEMCVDASDESHQWLKTALAAVQAAASSLTEQETTK
jgi:hypothetical protein